jgi:hypothetical protein
MSYSERYYALDQRVKPSEGLGHQGGVLRDLSQDPACGLPRIPRMQTSPLRRSTKFAYWVFSEAPHSPGLLPMSAPDASPDAHEPWTASYTVQGFPFSWAEALRHAEARLDRDFQAVAALAIREITPPPSEVGAAGRIFEILVRGETKESRRAG